MTRWWILVAFVFLAGVDTSSSPHAPRLADCGVVPVKPVPPVGCKDLIPRCVCNERGDYCVWQWLCVPN